MNWLSQNWLWLLLGLGMLVVLTRGGHHRRRGWGHHGGTGYAQTGDFDHGDHGGGSSVPDHSQHSSQAALAIDPVTRKDVSTATALTSIYQGRIYYFESAENRQRFEAAPEQFAREGLGRPVGPTGPAQGPGEYRDDRRPRRRGGC